MAIRSYCHTYSRYPRVSFCLSTELRPGASSTRHRRFPGAKGTLCHSSNNFGRRIHRILTQSTIYSICSVLHEKVYQSRITNMDELKTRLIDECEYFHQSIVDAAIAEWLLCLSVCVRVSGAYFEHQFQKYINSALLSSTCTCQRLLS